MLKFYFGLQALNNLFTKTAFDKSKVATRVRHKIWADMYHLASDPTTFSQTTTKSYQSELLQQYDSTSQNDVNKWNRTFKSWKTRGKNLFDIFTAAGYRFDVIMKQPEITPNFLESMRNMDFELFCYIVERGEMPTKSNLEDIGYRNARGLEKIRYNYYYGDINSSQYLRELQKSNEKKTHKEKMTLKRKQEEDEEDEESENENEDDNVENLNKRQKTK